MGPKRSSPFLAHGPVPKRSKGEQKTGAAVAKAATDQNPEQTSTKRAGATTPQSVQSIQAAPAAVAAAATTTATTLHRPRATNSPPTNSPRPALQDSRTFNPALLSLLGDKYSVTQVSVISSSKMERKVRAVLTQLAENAGVGGKPALVLLHARAAVAGKMISIVEVAKREMEAQGKEWFQYNAIEGQLGEKKQGRTKEKNVISEESGRGKGQKKTERDRQVAGSGGLAADGPGQGTSAHQMASDASLSTEKGAHVEEEEDGQVHTDADPADAINDSESESDAFETMEVIQQRPASGAARTRGRQKLIRAVPVMSIYLSRARVPELETAIG